MVNVMKKAEHYAYRPANCIMDVYCHYTAGKVGDLWEDLSVHKGVRLPSEEWIQDQLLPKLTGCLGDYEDGKLSQALKTIRNHSPSNKRQKRTKTDSPSGVVDLTNE